MQLVKFWNNYCWLYIVYIYQNIMVKGWFSMEKAINFKIDSELYKKIKIKTVMEDITIKQYILGLIKKDIENSEESISDFVEK